MNSGHIDISSDEEEPGRDDPEDEEDNYDWVSELLDSVDDANGDDSDDIVVIGEVNTKPEAKSSKPTVTDVDDDCMVLDGDPDKPVSVVEDPGSGSDELLVVGEKGQIACRDYPHPRHLCAKFPFKTTLHEKHCGLCHCYVCDSLAPCVHWGTGGFNIDHCHATDKEETWKSLRKNFRTGKTAPLPASKFSMALPKLSQVPPHNVIRLASSSISQNQVCGPTIIRACSSASRTMPSVRNPGRSHQSQFLLSKNRAHLESVSKQLVGVRNNVVGRTRGHNIGNLGPQFVSSHPMFKRVGPVGGSLPMNQTTFGSSNNSSCTSPSRYSRNSTPMAASDDRNHLRWQNVHSTVHQKSSQPMGAFIGNQSASQGVYQYGNQNQNSSQNICPQGFLGASVTDMGFSDCNYSLVNNSCQSIQQPPVETCQIQQSPVETCQIQQLPVETCQIQQLLVDSSQIQSTEPMYGPSPVKEQSNEIGNLSGLDKGFESWLLDNESVPAETNDSASSHLHVLSPEPTFVDAGMLMFDFETSWNGLTQL